MWDEAEDDDFQIVPRRWTWVGFVVEIIKVLVGLTRALYVFADSLRSFGEGVYTDTAAHYNWTLQQNEFRDAVARDLESIQEL